MNLDDIRTHWQQSGEQLQLADTVTPTSRDPYLADLERACILAHLRPEHRVLEVGCGDAKHSLVYAGQVEYLWGVDVADSLLAAARRRLETSDCRNVAFIGGSVLEAQQHAAGKAINCVISQRCLINLPTWAYQQQAIAQIHALLPLGGLFLMTEGFQEELDTLNRVREQAGLTAIQVASYNRNLRHAEFDAFIADHFTVEVVHDYGFYLFQSRVYHPLAVLPEQPKHADPLNAAAAQLSRLVSAPDFRQYSYNLCYVLRKT